MTPYRSVALALVLAATTAPPAVAQEASRRLAVRDTALDNGLHVVVMERHTVALATVLIGIRSGAATQQPGEAGLAHLYEHVLFRSFRSDPSSFGWEVAALNGSYNGSTAEEVVTYYIIVPSENTDRAISLMGELLPRARFYDHDLEEERPVVLDEIARDQSDPERVLDRQVSRALWGDAWHRRDIGGDSLSLESITLDQLRDTFARYYVPNNAVLVVTGDVSVADVFAAAQRHFGEWPAAAEPFAGPPPVPFTPLGAQEIVTLSRPVQDVLITFRYQGPSVRTDTTDTYAMDALLEILNDPTSPFQQQLVANGPFLQLDVSYRVLNDVGEIAFTGRTDQRRARLAVVALVGALDGPPLQATITEESLAIARKRRALDRALAREETPTLAPSLAYWWATAGIGYYRTYADRLSRQTTEDLVRVAERYIARQPRAVGLLGPGTSVEGPAARLRQMAPTAR